MSDPSLSGISLSFIISPQVHSETTAQLSCLWTLESHSARASFWWWHSMETHILDDYDLLQLAKDTKDKAASPTKQNGNHMGW